MAIAGQRAAQPAFKAGTQSARAMGRAARASGGMTSKLIVQRDDGWFLLTEDASGRQVATRYEINEDESGV
jgi:hypothetical protein